MDLQTPPAKRQRLVEGEGCSHGNGLRLCYDWEQVRGCRTCKKIHKPAFHFHHPLFSSQVQSTQQSKFESIFPDVGSKDENSNQSRRDKVASSHEEGHRSCSVWVQCHHSASRTDFGDEAVAEIARICEPALVAQNEEIDIASIEIEWVRFKTEIYNRKHCDEYVRKMSWCEQWEKHEKYPGLISLVNLLLPFLSSSVDAERGFSRMKLVKNDWRSCLGESTLSDLMLIFSECESVRKYDPTDAVNWWNSSGKRSPFYNDQKSLP
ncbi:uncharacterized protein LOC127839831 [Dreissena polymorpha]|uniref:uncharacterized protein LOC127839831 n=1 Tax=Dreissena polymorpha TaxID=45954 RepID=UPI0022647CDD|nr:uncharacterized protein LOC127839831 [Dreissena polymorpha]